MLSGRDVLFVSAVTYKHFELVLLVWKLLLLFDPCSSGPIGNWQRDCCANNRVLDLTRLEPRIDSLQTEVINGHTVNTGLLPLVGLL